MAPLTVSPHVRFVTGNYERLQGLRLVPFGLTALVTGLILAFWPSTPSFVLFLALVLPAVLLTEAGRRWADRYYAQTFGTVQAASPLPRTEVFLFDRGTSWQSRLLPGVAVGLVVGVLVALNVPSYLIIAGGAVLWALVLVSYLSRLGQVQARRYWVAGAVIMALVGLVLALPLAALAALHTESEVFRFLGMVLAPYGLVFLVCSLLDNRLLASRFASAAGATRAAAL